MDDLTTLFPEAVVETFGGREVVVRELTVRQLPRFLKAAGPFLASLTTGEDIDAAPVLAHLDALVTAVSVATGVDEEWLGDRPAGDLLRLLEMVVEVNAGFFVHRLPAFAGAVATIVRRTADGSTPSGD